MGEDKVPACRVYVRRNWLDRTLLTAWMWLNVSGEEYRGWKHAGGGVYREQNEGEERNESS